MVRSKENIEIVGKYEAICKKKREIMKSIAKIWRDPNDPKYQFNKMDTEKNDSIASWKHDSSESNCSQRHEELKRSPKIACSSTVAVPIN